MIKTLTPLHQYPEIPVGTSTDLPVIDSNFKMG